VVIDVEFNFDVLGTIYDNWGSKAVEQNGNKPLIPIGECYAIQYKVLMDLDGRIFAADFWGIQEDLGDSIEEAIERFVSCAFNVQ
jgi:hypothetical protein